MKENSNKQTGSPSETEQDAKEIKAKDLFAWMINKGVPAELVSRLYDLWQVSLKVGTKVYSIGKIIVSKAVEFAKDNPNMCAGIAIGIALSWLLDQIPVLGWFIGPFITLMLTLYFLYKGHLTDNPNGNIHTACNVYLKVVIDIMNAIKQELTSTQTNNNQQENCNDESK